MRRWLLSLAWALLLHESAAFLVGGGTNVASHQQSLRTKVIASSQTCRLRPDGQCHRQRSYGVTMQQVDEVESGSSSDTIAANARKKVVVIGAGWAGLAAAYELSKQSKDFDVTLLEGGKSVGGLVAGWLTPGGRPVEAGVHGFWYPYRNIFRLIEKDLKIDPFTPWTQSAQYSPEGLEVISPIFQNMPRLPSPLGTFLYPSFLRLPWSDRLTALGVLASVVDWDNTPEAWRK